MEKKTRKKTVKKTTKKAVKKAAKKTAKKTAKKPVDVAPEPTEQSQPAPAPVEPTEPSQPAATPADSEPVETAPVYAFPTRSRCPRCGSTDTISTGTIGVMQYRRCRNPVCRWNYKSYGKRI